ncbi:hypothetical protein HDV01_003485 [Terramyces sp. JEL0728]|nr:hypothetical protein HDV01_003485 [Terramyces sp. JEL0728]
MDLQSFPQDIQFQVINKIGGIDLLNLSVSSKHYYQLLSEFRSISSCLVEQEQWNVWPSIKLLESTLKHGCDYQDKCFPTRFIYSRIVVESNIYMIMANKLPQSRYLTVVLDRYTSAKDLKEILLDKNLSKFVVTPLADPTVFIQAYDLLQTTYLVELCICFCEIGDEQLAFLLNSLPGTLTSMSLSNNEITDLGAIELTNYMKNSKLMSLNVTENQISFPGLKRIAETLCYCRLTELKIEGNRFGQDDWYILFENLPKTSLQTLDIAEIGERSQLSLNNNIYKSKVSNLKMAVPQFYHESYFDSIQISNVNALELSGKEVPTSDTFIFALLQLKIESLTISDFQQDKLALSEILLALNVKHLSFVNIDLLVDEQLVKNLECCRLVSFSCKYCRIDEQALLNLANGVNQSSIRCLDLTGNVVTLTALVHFIDRVKDSKLRKLCLINCTNEFKNVKTFRRLIRENDIIHQIDVEF